MDISSWIAHHSHWSPEKVALRFGAEEITYADLEKRVARVAGGLANELKIQPGDRVAYLGWNSPVVLELLFACARLGAIFVPFNARMTVEQHRFFLLDSEPRCIVIEADFRQHVEHCFDGRDSIPVVVIGAPAEESIKLRWEAIAHSSIPMPVNADLALSTPLLIAYTSGTTGRAKGALLSQEAFFYNALNAASAFELTSQDEVLTCLPMFHVGGLNIHTTPALYTGATVTIHRQFDPTSVLQELEQRGITLLLLVPPLARTLISHRSWKRRIFPKLRLVAIGSTIVPLEVMRPWFARAIPITQVYGLTETCPVAIVVPIQDCGRKLGAVGKPVRYCQARIVDVNGNDVAAGERGEIVVRGPNVFTRYWMNPEATRDAFTGDWFHTGDVGHTDAEEYFYIDERLKDIIIVGASNVYPADVERILVECEAISEAVVVSRPDPELGEVPVACVVLRAGHVMSADQIKALFKDRLAEYQHPRDVLFMESLPHTALGKVQKSLIREQVKLLMRA